MMCSVDKGRRLVRHLDTRIMSRDFGTMGAALLLTNIYQGFPHDKGPAVHLKSNVKSCFHTFSLPF